MAAMEAGRRQLDIYTNALEKVMICSVTHTENQYTKKMPKAGRRRKKSYSPEKIQGLQVVSTILQDIRLSQPDHASFRRFIALLENRTGETFTISAIQRYESAGRITDTRFGVINDIHEDYIRAIEPFSPYPVEWLLRASEGDFIFMESFSGKTLKEIIDERQEQLGKRWRQEMKKWGITESEIEDAREGLISQGSLLNLSGLLDAPIEEIQLAAIFQLREQVQSQDAEDGENSGEDDKDN